jgi:GT2 family glycosyltransferase
VRHIARILYHWRAIPQSTASGADAKPYALTAAAAAVGEYLEKTGRPAQVSESEHIGGMLRVRYPLPEKLPLVSIVIPTRNGLELIRRCIESIEEKTEYRRFEIIVVDNNSDDPETIDYLDDLQKASRIRLLHYDKAFNYSAINNFAVTHASGEYLAFLNNDLEIIASDWLGEMVSHAQRKEVGAVGARLLYPDGRIQHAGVVLGLGGVAGHAMKYFPREDKGYNARLVLIQNYSAVTAACLLIRREVFEHVKGFDEVNLPVAFNDVDFCLRVREAGYNNLWTPYAELFHHESATRGPEDTPEKQKRFSREIDYMQRRWKAQLAHDPAYNPNLTRDAENFALTTH